MSTLVTIAGENVDADDPCAVASALKRARLKLAAGGGVIVTRFGEDEVRFEPGNLKALDRLIVDYDGQCAIKSGKPRQRRYAKRLTFI
jgi:hypothetical protein